MFLYRTEVKGIQAWILGSGKLREISGGSELVDSLGKLASEQGEACGATVLQAAAGAASLRFRTREDLEAFARHWPLALAVRAPGLTAIQAWVEAPDDEQVGWTAIQQRLAEARNRPMADLPEAGPLLARAGRTGLPAVARGEEAALDRASRARLAAFRGGRDRLAERLLEDREARFLEDLDRFPEGYLAVVHADANSVGRLFAEGKVRDPRAFSRELEDATLEAARAAVRVLVALLPPDSKGFVRARPIVLGGDDFTVIVPARHALAFTKEFLGTFENATALRVEHLGTRMTACAGIAIVKPGWPFHAAHDLAEGLCRAAKKAFRDSGRSGLAFHRVTTALSADWGDLVRGPLAVPDSNQSVSPGEERAVHGRTLTQNPYALERIPLLETLATAARGMPRGALRTWVALTRTNPAQGQEHWLRMREVTVASAPDRLAAFDEALRAMGCNPENGWDLAEAATTPVLDALEWQQVQARRRERAAHVRTSG